LAWPSDFIAIATIVAGTGTGAAIDLWTRRVPNPLTIGLAATGGVITSAGFVLAGTFAALATLPLTQFTEMGFAIALGVLLDTLVVRSVLVTALNLDLGDRIWWPSRLSRRPADEVGADLVAPEESRV